MLPLSGQSSVLLIGKNGAGKTTVGLALGILQKIARGINRANDLLKPKDAAIGAGIGRSNVAVRFEIQAELDGKVYEYTVAFELWKTGDVWLVLDETFAVDSKTVYSRQLADVHIENGSISDSAESAASQQPIRAQFKEAWLPVDRHLVALPILQERSAEDPLFVFKQWLGRMLILQPIPSLIGGESKHETLAPNSQVTDFAAWFSGVLAHAPAAYGRIDEYLKQVMPDLGDIKNPVVGREQRSLFVQFSNNLGSIPVPFEDLSDGEKCFMICALVLAANDAYGPLLCFWDEPDSHLSLDEVGHFVLALRKGFQSGGQFIATSHNPEAIRRFSDENTLVLYRKSHLEPTLVRPLSEIQISGDLVGALVRGDVEP